LWCWGYNAYGQLGLGDKRKRSTPTQVGDSADWL
jgi:alpha-tubulin suppressor-like RCC1 family protein